MMSNISAVDGDEIDLNELLIQNPIATIFMRVSGTSMLPFLRDQDILVVDKSLDVENDDIVVAISEGGFIVKRYHGASNTLTSDNDAFPTVTDFEIFGVVSSVVRKQKRNAKPENQ